MRGHCADCRAEVEIDGRPGDAHESVWSHMREHVWLDVVPGHADGCYGDCDRHGCPVPVPEQRCDIIECGPVYPLPEPEDATTVGPRLPSAPGVQSLSDSELLGVGVVDGVADSAVAVIGGQVELEGTAELAAPADGDRVDPQSVAGVDVARTLAGGEALPHVVVADDDRGGLSGDDSLLGASGASRESATDWQRGLRHARDRLDMAGDDVRRWGGFIDSAALNDQQRQQQEQTAQRRPPPRSGNDSDRPRPATRSSGDQTG